MKQPICKAFIEFTFRHIPLNFSLYLLNVKQELIKVLPSIMGFKTSAFLESIFIHSLASSSDIRNPFPPSAQDSKEKFFICL
nr:hypothetical protein [Aphanizomenon flos-aquae]